MNYGIHNSGKQTREYVAKKKRVADHQETKRFFTMPVLSMAGEIIFPSDARAEHCAHRSKKK